MDEINTSDSTLAKGRGKGVIYNSMLSETRRVLEMLELGTFSGSDELVTDR